MARPPARPALPHFGPHPEPGARRGRRIRPGDVVSFELIADAERMRSLLLCRIGRKP
jgi:hypothetical protein